MIPWILLDTATIPGEQGAMRLLRRGGEFSIRLGQGELMNSRLSGSEEDLATLSAERIEGRARPRVLIGGLGMGFTLRAALTVLPADAEIVVAELVPAVVAWGRGPMAELFKGCLDDPRVTIREADVTSVIAERPGAWDAILLDVDNGPEGMTRGSNDGLYDMAGLGMSRVALRPGGVLAIWSSGPDTAFSRRLGNSGFESEEVRVHARKGHGTRRHVIWLARKPAQRASSPASARPAGAKGASRS